MVKKMSRIIHYINLFFLAIYYKCKTWWQGIWNFKKSPAISEIKIETLVSSESYNSRFTNNGLNSEITIVKEVWDQIDNTISKETVFPNPSTVNFLKPMRSDYYNLLFPYSPVTPSLFVDRSVWADILSHVPEGYGIPPTVTLKLMKPMSSEYYENMFSPLSGNTKVFVDNRIWEEIMKNLPSTYVIPNDNTNISTWTKRQSVGAPIIMKHQLSNSS